MCWYNAVNLVLAVGVASVEHPTGVMQSKALGIWFAYHQHPKWLDVWKTDVCSVPGGLTLRPGHFNTCSYRTLAQCQLSYAQYTVVIILGVYKLRVGLPGKSLSH